MKIFDNLSLSITEMLKDDEPAEPKVTYYLPALGSNFVSHPGGNAPNSDMFFPSTSPDF